MRVARGARIYGEVIGFGASGDAFHMVAPAPDGEGAARCMQMAVDDAGIQPSEVQYVNAHGTSTDLNDKYETQAIKTVFGDHAYKMAVSSTKSMTGHLLGAAGGVEAAFTVLSLYNEMMPPTINYEFPDPDCDLDYVPNVARKAKIEVAHFQFVRLWGNQRNPGLQKVERRIKQEAKSDRQEAGANFSASTFPSPPCCLHSRPSVSITPFKPLPSSHLKSSIILPVMLSFLRTGVGFRIYFLGRKLCIACL